jgi:hypothetical protein
MNIATETANKQFQYDAIVRGKSLHYWALKANASFCRAKNVKVFSLHRGTFGYDNMIMSIGYAFQETTSMEILRKSDIASKIRQGWITNYVYWRDNQPYKNENSPYIATHTPLGDDYIDMRALLPYSELSAEEKEQGDFMAEILMNLLVEELLAS